jgi:hypothetical protein
MNETTFFSLIQSWKGTPMEAVMNILRTGKFVEPTEPVVKNKIAGLMSPLEKAIFSQLDSLENTMKEKLAALASSSGDDVSVKCFECPSYRMGGICPAIKEVREIKRQFDDDGETLKALLSHLIYELLGVHSFFVAKGFLIISTDENFKSTYKKNRRNTNTKGEQELFEESIKGTFLETAINLMETEEFQDHEMPIAEGEKIITELNSFEKSMLTIVLKYNTEIKAILKEFKELSKSNALEQILGNANPLAELFGGFGFGGFGLGIMMFDMNNKEDQEREKKAQEISEKLGNLVGHGKTLEMIFYGMIETQVVSDALDNRSHLGVRNGFKLVSFEG